MKPALGLLALAFAWAPAVAGAQTQQDPSLSSGGLAPPPAIESETTLAPPSETEEDLARADREDAGRGLSFFWLNGEVGYQTLGLHTFHANELVDANVVASTQNGLLVGVGAGVRLIFLTVGGRFRLGTFDKWQLWTLNAELGLRIPLGAIEPYFTFGGGYASLGSFDSSSVGAALDDAGVNANGLDIRGFDLRGGVGLDYFIGSTLSVGANLSGDVLFLSRSKVSGTSTSGGGSAEEQATAEVYSRDGSSVGGALTLTAVVGLHF